MDGNFIFLFVIAFCFNLSCASMRWTLLEDTQAVCNDYSRAGFYIETTETTKWVIFLESGGLCYSPETCNRRFFKPEVRLEFATNRDEQFYEIEPDFDFNKTWETLVSLNRSLSERINPYMTSIGTYIKDNERLAEIEGRDFLDSSRELNPMFYDFNRVVVPYCSSDSWLAEDSFVSEGVDLSSKNPQMQFLDKAYSPETEELQFTFRGRTIFKGVIKQLLQNTNFSGATEILLAGSSAGGLGVVNNAQWVLNELDNNTVVANISLLIDSSWFVNFRGNINRYYNGEVVVTDSSAANRKDTRLFDLINSIPQCDVDILTGSPCCLSLECVLLDERYFPVGQIPVMVVFSLYDVFLLADAIAQETLPGELTNSKSLPSLGIQFIQTISEYGGAMNSSIVDTVPQADNFSFIATQCFQHVYFATSTLWDSQSILRDSSSAEISATLGSFSGSLKHSIQSNVWSNYTFADDRSDTGPIDSCNKSEARTMQDAVNMWYRCRYNKTFEFRDSCYSVHCHSSCPEDVELLTLAATSYPDWSILLIVCVVVSFTIVSVMGKIALYLWKIVLFKKQDEYLERVEKDEENFMDGIPKFPVCGLEDAVSIACLDLQYSVKFRKQKVKDERKDSTTVSFAIAHHIAEEEQEELLTRGSERRSTRSTRSTRSSRTEAQRKHSTSYLGVISEDSDNSTEGHQSSGINEKLTENDESKTKENHKMSASSLQRQNAYDKKDSSSSITHSEPEMYTSTEDIDGVESDSDESCVPCKGETKHILKGVSIYFNPGELVGIMGPSGCGKTTFLDILTGRRKSGQIQGDIFVNGIPLDCVRDEYLSFTGYVLQLATPYYEELTVRENLTLAAQMKLPRKMTWREKFERVEQVIDVTGLTSVADVMVGGLSSPGLSGGQKKRLSIALQLLTMPKVIFLDEPTSGLDSTASVELLSHLNNLADSNRTVVLTIHQPRLEIFHMFHKLILLSDGKIAYHGVPQKAYRFFVEAAVSSFWNKKLTIPEIGDHNPADIIMDMLGKPIFRRAILSHYQASTEPELIKWAIRQAKVKDFESISIATLDTDDPTASFKRASSTTSTSPYQIHQSDFVKQDKASWFNRLAVLETRADKRATLIWTLYLPVIFFVYGFVLGTTYLQQDQPLLIMAGFCVYSVASALFMFPVMQNYFIKALEVYGFENADGAGRASDIVIQAVARFSTMAIIPVVLCSAVLYLLLVKYEFWSLMVLLKLIVVAMALNQTWIALLTCLLCSLPSLAFRLSPIISSVAGFSSGFFIPKDETGWWYRWIFYINPNYYGFSASANILLSEIQNDCNDGEELFECYASSGNYVLKQFQFDEINPYMNIAILLMMTAFYLLLAVFSNWLRHTTFFLNLQNKLRTKKNFMDTETDLFLEEDETNNENQSTTEDQCIPEVSYPASERDSEEIQNLRDIPSPYEDDVFTSEESKKPNEAKQRWIRFAQESLEKKNSPEEIELECKAPVVDSLGRPRRLDFRQKKKRKRVQSIFLDNQEHMVYKPLSGQTPTTPGGQFANLVSNIVAQRRADSVASTSPSNVGSSLKERREQFDLSVKTTQEVVKIETEELNKVDELQRETKTFRDVTKMLTERLREQKTPKMANVVGEVMKVASSAPSSFDDGKEDPSDSSRPRSSSTTGVTTHSRIKRRQRQDSSSNLFIQKVRDIAKKPRMSHQQSPSPAMKKMASFAFPVPPKGGLKRGSTDMTLPLSGTRKSVSDTSVSPYLEEKPTTSPGLYKLEEIEEEPEGEETEYHTPHHGSVPDVRLSQSIGKEKLGKYRKLSDPGSPPPVIETELNFEEYTCV